MYLINDIDYNCVTAFVRYILWCREGISRHRACRYYFSLRMDLFKYRFWNFEVGI